MLLAPLVVITRWITPPGQKPDDVY